MAHIYPKIEASDIAGKGNVGQPDTPGLTTGEMQAKLDELPNIIIQKFNELVDEMNEYIGNVMNTVPDNINAIRINNNSLEFSYDGGQTWGSSGSGITVSASIDDITMDTYEIAEQESDIATTDTLNQALGKLEKRIELLEAVATRFNNQIGDISIKPKTMAEYEALPTKDANTYYPILES